MVGIYKITSPSNRIYIGQSVNIRSRFITYKSINKSRGLTKLYRSFLKYGVKEHVFEVIELCEIGDLNERERYWQDYYNATEDGLNCFLTDTSEKKRVRSKETLKNMSDGQKKSFLNGREKVWLGKKHTAETKALISQKAKGRKFSDEVNKKKGRVGRVSPMKGKFSYEHSKSIPILQYSLAGEFIKEWLCGLDIKRETGMNNTNICSCCKGDLRTSSGFIWKYKTAAL